MRCIVNDKTNSGQDDFLDEQIKRAYGFSDQQLEQEMDYAIAHPDNSPRLKAPDDEFQRIMEKAKRLMRENGHMDTAAAASYSSDHNSDLYNLPHDHSITNINNEEPGSSNTPRPPRRNWKKYVQAAAIAAVIGAFGVQGVMSTVGRSGFKYGDGRSGAGDSVRVWNNVSAPIEEVSQVEKAYDEMRDELNIPILKLKYVPTDMMFDSLTLENDRAIVKFNYKGYVIRLVEIEGSLESSNTHVSDRKEYGTRFNRLLGTEIILSKNDLDDDLTEYSAEIETDIAYYYLSGIMDEDEFLQIVEQMYFIN